MPALKIIDIVRLFIQRSSPARKKLQEQGVVVSIV